MASVSLRNIGKQYPHRPPVIHGVDLEIADGELIVLVGPSGCGKSTLLRMIAGLEEISSGDLHIGGIHANQIGPAQRKLAMVFQSYALYPHMSVFENMAFALQLAGQKPGAVRAAVERAAAILQIGHLLERKPKELSGGQRQRVAIGRAIVRTPEVFLFDEPLSNLDASLRVQMRVEISRLHQELKTTMIYVTHDQVEAMTLGQRIVVINAGRIEQVGTPFELYNHPGNLFVAGFLGAPRMNFIGAQAVQASALAVRVRLAGGALIDVAADGSSVQPGEPLTLGARAEHMTLRAAGQGLPNTVDVDVGHVEYLGDQTILYCAVGGSDGLIAVRQAGIDPALRSGSRIGIELAAQRCHLFDRNGRALGSAVDSPVRSAQPCTIAESD